LKEKAKMNPIMFNINQKEKVKVRCYVMDKVMQEFFREATRQHLQVPSNNTYKYQVTK